MAFNDALVERGYALDYEKSVLAFVTSPQKRKYNPDWTIRPGWYIETKGKLDRETRKKMLYVKEQHPAARILVVFQRHQNPLHKGAATTYGEWCDKHGIEWCGFEDTKTWCAFIQEAFTQR